MSDKLEDDWMNPPTSASFVPQRHADGVFYLIQRKRRQITYGTGSLEYWDMWSEFETKESRDAELARLRETTSWQLRGRRATYRHGEMVDVSNPGEFTDD